MEVLRFSRGSRWLPPCVACALLFSLDAALFRTGLYRPLIEPQSYAGETELALRQASARDAVVVVGDSRIAEGFSATVANGVTHGAPFFVNASVHGSTLRCWYYLLREANPNPGA